MQWKVVIVALSLSLTLVPGCIQWRPRLPARCPPSPADCHLPFMSDCLFHLWIIWAQSGWMDGWQEEYLHESFLLHRHDYGDGDLNGNMRNMLPMPVHPAVFVEKHACNHTSGSFW